MEEDQCINTEFKELCEMYDNGNTNMCTECGEEVYVYDKIIKTNERSVGIKWYLILDV